MDLFNVMEIVGYADLTRKKSNCKVSINSRLFTALYTRCKYELDDELDLIQYDSRQER